MSLGLNALPAQQHSRSTAVLLFGGATVGIISLHLATNGTLGFHTDELYYLACGRHPALGYVDFPPVVPLLARLETGLLGVSPWTLRTSPKLVAHLTVPYDVVGLEQGAPVTFCQLKAPVPKIWGKLRNFS
jgi:hypothetical protein